MGPGVRRSTSPLLASQNCWKCFIETSRKILASLMKNYFPKRPSDAPLHTLSKLYDVSVGFVTPPLIWYSIFLYLRSLKGGCCLISDDLSCSCQVKINNKVQSSNKVTSGSPWSVECGTVYAMKHFREGIHIVWLDPVSTMNFLRDNVKCPNIFLLEKLIGKSYRHNAENRILLLRHGSWNRRKEKCSWPSLTITSSKSKKEAEMFISVVVLP